MINRSAVMIRPQQPFLQWVNALEHSHVVSDSDCEPTAYLLPVSLADDEAWSHLETVYLDIFDAELEAWDLDETHWPAGRTFSMFQEWFEIHMISMIQDLVEGPIVEEDDD